MDIDVFTLFPQWFDWFREQRHVRNVIDSGSSITCVSPREFTPLTGGQVDDTPFGGGAGMVLRVDVMDIALRGYYGRDALEVRKERRIVALIPGGRILDDGYVNELAAESSLTFLCGRYEGFDERIVQNLATDTLSVGRYVLTGGELAAMVAMDAVLRKLPGARALALRGGGCAPGPAGRVRTALPAKRGAGPMQHAPRRWKTCRSCVLP